MTLCECGCGQTLIPDKRGRIRRFVYQHQRRGKNHSMETRTLLSKISRSTAKFGPEHPGWKENISDICSVPTLHRYLWRRMPRPSSCPSCGRDKRLDLCNISRKYDPNTYNRCVDNWFYACRSCHLKYDRPVDEEIKREKARMRQKRHYIKNRDKILREKADWYRSKKLAQVRQMVDYGTP